MDQEDQHNAEASGSQLSGPSFRDETAGTNGEPKLSKNAQKKAARMARMLERKPLKRQAEKIRRQQRAQDLSTGYAAGTLSEADKQIFEERRAREREKRNAKQLEKKAGNRPVEGKLGVWGGAVIMDLGFDELMTDNEIASMDSQLTFSYSVNRLSALPFSSLIHTSASLSRSPRLMARMNVRNIDKWTRCHWNPDHLEVLVEQFRAEEREVPSGLKRGQELVYLSADSDEELETLDENAVYIIGGIVDRNRHKNKAEKLGIRTARLPIGTYLASMPTRKVLTVNQVFAILVEYNIRKDWKEASEAVIPARKMVEKKRKRGKTRGAEMDGEAGADDAGDDSSDDDEGMDAPAGASTTLPMEGLEATEMTEEEEAVFNAS